MIPNPIDAIVAADIEALIADSCESPALSATRDVLLPKLLSGEICVRKATGALK